MSRGKRPSKTPNARSAELLRWYGYLVHVAERWVTIPNHPAGGVRQDAWGCIDLVAVHPDPQVPLLFVQPCAASRIADHCAKVRAVTMELPDSDGKREVLVLPVLAARGRVEVWGWEPPGEVSSRWRLRVVNVATGEDSGIGIPARAPRPVPLLDLAAGAAR